jgi:YVTN family beta-propeller protein
MVSFVLEGMTNKLRAAATACVLIAVTFLSSVSTVLTQTAKPALAVLNKAEANMAIIDPVSMKVVAKVAVGDGPHEVVFSADGKTAYAANYGGAQGPGNSISVIDMASAKELRRFDTSPLVRPHGLQFIGGKLYFTAETNRIIARYDPTANKIDWMMGTGQNGSHMIAVSADQKRFYTANIGSDSITAFELPPLAAGRPQVIHIPVGKQPEAIDLSPDGKEIWTGLNVDGAIDIVDTTTNKFKEKVNIGGRPYRVKFTPDGKQVVCTMLASKEIIVLDAATRKELRRMKLESVPMGIVFSADGKTAFVTIVGPDAVIKVDLEKMEVKGRVDSGKGPDGIAVTGY